MGYDTTERAYILACSGDFPSVAKIVTHLKAEGHLTVLTDLRSRIFRRELREICSRMALQRATSGPGR